MRKRYPTDLTDEQWALIEPLLPKAKPGGRPREVDLREVVNALFYQARTGCQWDFLPHDFPPKGTVYDYFARFHDDGTWQGLVDALRGRARTEAGRDEWPSAALIDTQTVKPPRGRRGEGLRRRQEAEGTQAPHRHRHHGVAAGRGRHGGEPGRRHPRPGGAGQARPAGPALLRLEVVFGDNKYNNRELDGWLEDTAAPYRVESVQSARKEGRFKPQKLRWAVERTIAWLGRWRRLSKDYEHNTSSSEAWVKVAAIQQMTRRLRPNPNSTQPEFKYPKPAQQLA